MRDRSPRALWDTALGQLELQVTRPNFETWLRNTVGIESDASHFVVGAPSDFAVEWLRSRMNSLINRTVSQIAGSTISVSFQVLGAPPVGQSSSFTGQPPPTSAAGPPVDLDPRLTFDSFTVVGTNRLACRAAKRLADGDQRCNPLVLSGAPGLGKTHLLHAIGHHVLQAERPVVALTAESFVDRYGKAVRAGRPHTFRELFEHCGFLLVDDLSFLVTRSASQEQFFHIIDSLYSAGCFLAVTIDTLPDSLNGFTARLRSRLQAGLTACLLPPTTQERLEILLARCAREQRSLPLPVLKLIAGQSFDNIRELAGALNRVTAFAELSDEPLSDRTALQALYPLTGPRPQPRPDIILSTVCKHFHVTVEQLAGPSRARDLTYARHLAMYLLRRDGSQPLSEIGRILGKRDHSTVLSGCRRIERESTALPQTENDIQLLRAALRTEPAA